MTKRLDEAIPRIVVSMDEEPQSQKHQPQPGETIHIHYFPDAIVILKDDDKLAQVVESTPVVLQKSSMLPAYVIGSCYLLLIVATLAFQCYCMFNPPIATITILPKSQTVTMSGTVQLGRILPALTISQSQTTPATGKGHQSARAATGYLTLYNGQFQQVFIAGGTILTGASGVQIITDYDTTIPAAIPPSFGQASISAHAISPGVRGNIPAYDINQACCAASVLAKNAQPFTGGQDERTYTTVTHNDIHSISTVLKTTVAHSITGALQGQLHQGEAVQLLPCSPTIASDHPIGAEATQVKVTVSLTCSAVAYNSQDLATKAAAVLATQAARKLGTGYSVFGTVRVHVSEASESHLNQHLVFLSFYASGTWMYGLSSPVQEKIKKLIAGKTTQEALKLLASLPGVEHAAISYTGFGDATKLPKQRSYIHLATIVV